MKIGVTGHQRLPESAEKLLHDSLRLFLGADPRLTLVCCLAKGADQEAARVVLAGGGQVEAVIPCINYAETLVGDDREQYERLLEATAARRVLPFVEPSEGAFLAGGIVVVERADHLVAVWDGQPAQGLGGTADIVAYARQVGRDLTVVWPQGVLR